MFNKKIHRKLGLVGRVILAVGSMASVANGDVLSTEVIANNGIAGGGNNVQHDDKNVSFPSSELYDIWDGLWADAPVNPNPVWIRPSSSPYDVPLISDVRPSDSESDVDQEFAVMYNSSSVFSTIPQTRFKLRRSKGEMDRKPIVFQQHNPSDPNEIYPLFDVRRAIEENNGNVEIYDSDGNLMQIDNVKFPNNGDVYANGRISFDRWLADITGDKKVDLHDYAVLSRNYGRTGITEYGPQVPGNYADINRDGSVNLLDAVILHDDWLADYSGNLSQ